jgi:hypothetical protein
MSVTHQAVLDAMDGIAMILDHDLRITRIGLPNWQKFLDDNPPQDAARRHSHASVLDRPVTQFIVGDNVRSTFAELFGSVLGGARPVVRIDYRCDAPTQRRDMRLTVSPISTDGEVRHLLYQSVMLSIQQRPAIPLFGAPVAHEEAEDIVTLCAICARVAWPIGAPSGTREWIEPTEYYRRDGAEVTLISHGFCENCFSRLEDEN